MSWSVSLPADSSLISLSAAYIRTNNTGIQGVLTSTNLTNNNPYVPNTAPMWFYTNTAPTGWTATGVGGDTLLAIKGGASQYNTAGGTTNVGTWTGPSYTLQIADIPSHTHNYFSYGTSGGSNTVSGGNAVQINSISTSATGGGGAHHHDWTSTRPLASIGILCTKNT